MALDDNAAEEALDLWVASIVPPPPDGGVALKAAMRPMFRALYAKILQHAVITITMPPDGTGSIT